MPPDSLRKRLKDLRDSISTLERAEDLVGLGNARAEALSLSASTSGRGSRAAERIAEKATEAIEALRRNGVETDAERQAREEQEAREERKRSREESARLIRRLTETVELVLNDGTTSANGFETLRSLSVHAEDGGAIASDTLKLAEPWWWWITGAYEQSRLIFAGRGSASLPGRAREIEQSLKTSAVELMTAGAAVRELSADVVPLLAYALFTNKVPVTPDMATDEIAESVNDLLLGMADDVAALSTDLRLALVALLRLAILLGEAQAYADDAGLRALGARDTAFALGAQRLQDQVSPLTALASTAERVE